MGPCAEACGLQGPCALAESAELGREAPAGTKQGHAECPRQLPALWPRVSGGLGRQEPGWQVRNAGPHSSLAIWYQAGASAFRGDSLTQRKKKDFKGLRENYHHLPILVNTCLSFQDRFFSPSLKETSLVYKIKREFLWVSVGCCREAGQEGEGGTGMGPGRE